MPRRPLSLVVFTISTLGTLGPEAAKLVAALSHRNSGNVPGSLLDAARCWACPRLGPYLRQAVGLAARRGLARAVNETYRTVPVAPLLVPAVRAVGPAAPQRSRRTSLRSRPSLLRSCRCVVELGV